MASKHLFIHSLSSSSCLSLSQPCVQYWPEPGLQQYGPMQVEFLSMSADEDIITRLFRVKNVTRVSSINYHSLSSIKMCLLFPQYIVSLADP